MQTLLRAAVLHRFAVAIVIVTLAACQSKIVKPPPPTAPLPATDVAGATRYKVDSTASTVHILVYRGGAVARMGHNHVVSSNDLRGTVFLQPEFTRSRIELELPVATLIVDDAKSRSTEGADFAAEVPQDAREGTRRNLLRSEVLDAEHFPTITLQSLAIGGTRARAELAMRMTIRNVARDVPVIALVRQDGKSLTASGEFAIKQSDFGITPFSVGLGALQVVDQLKIKFSIVCRQQ
jgi:polyisoprenoid-binding protein YceI